MKVVSVLRASALLLVCGIVASSQKSSAQTDPTVERGSSTPQNPNTIQVRAKSSTVTITAAGQGHKIEAKGVDAAGNPTGTQYTASYDGKDVPVTSPDRRTTTQ